MDTAESIAAARLQADEQGNDERGLEMETGLLERYDWLMRQLEPEFTAGEWLLLECALNERPPNGAFMPERLAYIAADVADHDLDCAMMRGLDAGGAREVHGPEDVDAHAGVDRAGLARRLAGMHLAERVAVVDALERRMATTTIEQRLAAAKATSRD